MDRKENIVLVDFKPENKWKFLDALNEKTNKEWKVIPYESNKDRGNGFSNMKRYFKYFLFPFRIFLHRKTYAEIIAWQQFYGLIYAFYCKLFHCRKVNKLIVMTFIYKDKTGPLGLIYRSFIRYCIKSRYIDRIICFSSGECSYYSSLFHMDKDKFSFIPLGEELEESKPDDMKEFSEDNDYILAIGYSCRDYDFLIDTLRNKNYKVRIYEGKNMTHSDYIRMYKSISHDKLSALFANCRFIVIPLKNSNIAAGQLSMLHAMQLGKPVIVTDTKSARDYIIHGENGFIAPNKKQIWLNYIEKLYNNEELYQSMCRNALNRYHRYHSLEAMGRNIGNLVLSI